MLQGMPSILYRIYERQLWCEVLAKPTPRYIGIILDGYRQRTRSP